MFVGAANTAVLGTVTAVSPTGPGYMTVYPCSAGRPPTSSVNYAAGQTVSNAALVQSDSAGYVCIYTHASAHIIWDQMASTGYYNAEVPRRIIDTRG